MKKRILTLVFCLAALSTGTLAEEACIAPSLAPKTEQMFSPSANNPLKWLNSADTPENQVMSNEDRRIRFEMDKTRERNERYKKLGLSPEQKAHSEYLDKQVKRNAAPLLKKFKKEAQKLHEMKKRKASRFAVWLQEQEVKKAKRDIENYFDDAKKDFRKILNDEQKAKYDLMEKEQKAKREELKKQSRHRKPANPDIINPSLQEPQLPESLKK